MIESNTRTKFKICHRQRVEIMIIARYGTEPRQIDAHYRLTRSWCQSSTARARTRTGVVQLFIDILTSFDATRYFSSLFLRHFPTLVCVRFTDSLMSVDFKIKRSRHFFSRRVKLFWILCYVDKICTVPTCCDVCFLSLSLSHAHARARTHTHTHKRIKELKPAKPNPNKTIQWPW